MLQRVKEVQESDLRMVGALARNIQRVIAVTQADIDAAAAQGKAWLVKPVVKVSDPLDNLRGGTQLVIKQNSILPGQNVMRVMYIGGQAVVVGPGTSPLPLPDATDNDILSLIAFGGTEQRNLPDNYIERQFVYMMDGSYLLTDIVPTSDCKIEMDFQTTSVPAGNETFIGGRVSSTAGVGLLCAKIGSEIVFDAFGTGSMDRYSSGVAAQNNTRYKLTYNNQVATLESGGTTLFTNTFTGTNSNGAELAINATNSNGTITGNTAGIYLYSFKVWNAQGVLVADYVPAVQKGTVPVVGFYDTVSKTFKTATAGTFAAGGEAVPTPDAPMDIVSNNGVLKARHQSGLPLGYTLLEYIESSGTQYIDTGIGLNSAYKYRLVVGSVNANNASNIWGYKSNASYTGGPCCIIGWTGGGTTYIGAYNKNGNITGSFPSIDGLRWTAGTFFDILLDVTQSNFSVNDTNYYSTSGVSTVLTTDSWTNTHHPYLFGTQTVDSAVPSSAIRVKAYQVRDTNGDLIQNLVPCKNASNVVGMYDLVNGVFYQNAGTGDFVAGTAVSDPVEIYADGLQETIAIKDDQSATVSSAVAEMLLKVGNYQDQQEIIDGTVTRKVGIKVLDGTENWTIHSSGSMTIQIPHPQQVQSLFGYSTHFVGVQSSVTAANMSIGQYKLAATNNDVYFKTSYNNTTDWTTFLAQQYAAGTPVIVIYPLATPTTESVTAQPMQTVEGDNTAVITQASLNNLELQVEYIEA